MNIQLMMPYAFYIDWRYFLCCKQKLPVERYR